MAKFDVINPGIEVQVAGFRAKGKQIPCKNAAPIIIGRHISPRPRGKTYPYASTKRGGKEKLPDIATAINAALAAMSQNKGGG